MTHKEGESENKTDTPTLRDIELLARLSYIAQYKRADVKTAYHYVKLKSYRDKNVNDRPRGPH